MANMTGKSGFPRREFESVLLHSLRVMDQNREYLQMHLAQNCDEKTKQALDDMEQESVRMERTLRELMGLLAAEQPGKPPMKPMDLCWTLSEIGQMAPEVKKQLDVELTVECERLERCYVRAVPDEVEQLLFHLLSNALRAVGPGGHVAIRLTKDETDLHLTMDDDGCGLPDAENWMENRRRFLGGAKAGLLLCRRYCEHMGWELNLGSRTSGGTRAELLIPLVGTLFPIEGSVELRTAYPHFAAEGLRWHIRRELTLLSDQKKD